VINAKESSLGRRIGIVRSDNQDSRLHSMFLDAVHRVAMRTKYADIG
tara:strand:+ start:3992 stop:4132 length:141 start_codon:yes stop_codon:yes gene_type:complete